MNSNDKGSRHFSKCKPQLLSYIFVNKHKNGAIRTSKYTFIKAR